MEALLASADSWQWVLVAYAVVLGVEAPVLAVVDQPESFELWHQPIEDEPR